MSNPDTYLTIGENAEGVFRDRGSKFLAFAFPVSTEDEIKLLLEDLRKRFHDARHHCYAYRLGAAKKVYRANDDGEPAGSAGKPILGQIRSNDLSNVLIVVVRYFGGTLLGVGGLINAYRTAAADALRNASIMEAVESLPVKLIYPYSLTNEIVKIIKTENLRITDQEYTGTCRARLWVPASRIDLVCKRINKLDGASAGPWEESG